MQKTVVVSIGLLSLTSRILRQVIGAKEVTTEMRDNLKSVQKDLDIVLKPGIPSPEAVEEALESDEDDVKSLVDGAESPIEPSADDIDGPPRNVDGATDTNNGGPAAKESPEKVPDVTEAPVSSEPETDTPVADAGPDTPPLSEPLAVPPAPVVLTDDEVPGPAPVGTEPAEDKAFSSYNVQELLYTAAKEGAKVETTWSKADMRKAIIAHRGADEPQG